MNENQGEREEDRMATQTSNQGIIGWACDLMVSARDKLAEPGRERKQRAEQLAAANDEGQRKLEKLIETIVGGPTHDRFQWDLIGEPEGNRWARFVYPPDLTLEELSLIVGELQAWRDRWPMTMVDALTKPV